MQKIKLTGETFAPPLDFSLEKYLRRSFGMFTEELVRVKVRFHKSLTRYLLERRWHPSQKNKKLKDGSLELTIEVAGTNGIRSCIHSHSDRASHPFVAINSVGLSKELLESNLFGHEQGAFTGAQRGYRHSRGTFFA